MLISPLKKTKHPLICFKTTHAKHVSISEDKRAVCTSVKQPGVSVQPATVASGVRRGVDGGGRCASASPLRLLSLVADNYDSGRGGFDVTVGLVLLRAAA